MTLKRFPERHRHRYEVNTAYKDRLEQHGMRFAGMSPDGVLPKPSNTKTTRGLSGCNFTPS